MFIHVTKICKKKKQQKKQQKNPPSFEETPLFPVVVDKINVFYCSDDRRVFFTHY